MSSLAVFEQNYNSTRSYSMKDIMAMTGLSFEEIKKLYSQNLKGLNELECGLGEKDVCPLLIIGASKGVGTFSYNWFSEYLWSKNIDISAFSLHQIREYGIELIERRRSLFNAILKEQKKDERRSLESDFENKLIDFLIAQGINYERQIKAGKCRLDVLIPGELIIELKAGKIVADDVCQAADYLSFNELDVLLIGSALSDSASRGIEAINKLSLQTGNRILFVTHAAAFPYLRDILR